MYVSGLDPRDMLAVYRVPDAHAEAFWEWAQPLLDYPGDHGPMVIPTVLLDRPHERRHKGKPPQDAVILLEITCV